jgi:hypothetical protein
MQSRIEIVQSYYNTRPLSECLVESSPVQHLAVQIVEESEDGFCGRDVRLDGLDVLLES